MKVALTPTESNAYYDKIGGAHASCWVSDVDPVSACTKAVFRVKLYDWQVNDILGDPLSVSENDFEGRDIGLENYWKARKEGIAIVYSAWSIDAGTENDFFELKPSRKIDINSYLSKQNKLKRKGRCLHCQAGGRCNEIIKAHSIQEKRVLGVSCWLFTLSARFGICRCRVCDGQAQKTLFFRVLLHRIDHRLILMRGSSEY